LPLSFGPVLRHPMGERFRLPLLFPGRRNFFPHWVLCGGLSTLVLAGSFCSLCPPVSLVFKNIRKLITFRLPFSGPYLLVKGVFRLVRWLPSLSPCMVFSVRTGGLLDTNLHYFLLEFHLVILQLRVLQAHEPVCDFSLIFTVSLYSRGRGTERFVGRPQSFPIY